ncbi:putative DprA-like protein [Vibrio phage 249E41-1]|nr:putative DprA-like protein [Vibrio phage 249E41-1]CAH9017564.1 putative DprA-like protein [Vibrio phage 193E37-1]
MSKQIYYTMIGSRSTPPDIMELMVKFAEKACEFNYVGRSGGADGSDACLEQGVGSYLNSCEENYPEHYMEIYLPWKDFNGRDSFGGGYYTLPWIDNKEQATQIASETHPAWDRCSQGAKSLHSRNVYQLLGQDLNTPSRFVICWAEPKGEDGHVKGGTATAVKLGIDNGAEIINLYHEDQRKRVEDWINK